MSFAAQHGLRSIRINDTHLPIYCSSLIAALEGGKEMKLLFCMMFAAVSAAAMFMSVPAFADPPAAPLNFCNRTSEEVNVAVGYYSSGVHDNQSSNVLTGPFVSRGWSSVSGGQCHSFANPFDARYMFWFPAQKAAVRTHFPVDDATTSARHMCVSGETFTFEDQNVSIDACHADPVAASAGVRWVVGNKVDTEVDPNVNFTGYDY